MELNKTIQELKREVDTIKKTQSEETLVIESLGKKSGNIDVSISNRIQEMEERISGAEDSIEHRYKKPTEFQIDWTRKEIPPDT
jgi:predicted  nucleic acid-binding Zn-ribbon protein